MMLLFFKRLTLFHFITAISMSFRKELVTVNVMGDDISQEVYVDEETGMDVDTQSGVFRTREETETMIKDVYEVGRVSLRGELEKYNKWVQKAQGSRSGSADKATLANAPTFKKLGGSSQTYTTQKKKLVSAEGVISDGVEEKSKGNDYFGKAKYSHALICYRRAAQILENVSQKVQTTKREESEALRQGSVVWANMAECNIRLERFKCAHNCCRESLRLDPTNEKALHRLKVSLEAIQKNSIIAVDSS